MVFTLSTKKISTPKISTLPRGHLRQALIETSLRVIAEQGVRALTLREIGSRLNVSRMAPYRHFADKSALLGAIAVAGFQKFTEALETAEAKAGPDFEAQCGALASAYVRFAQENRAHFEVMFPNDGQPYFLSKEDGQIAHRSFLVLENLVKRGQQEGKMVDDNPTAIAQMIWSTVHGIATLGLGVDESFIRFCSEKLRTGLRPRNQE